MKKLFLLAALMLIFTSACQEQSIGIKREAQSIKKISVPANDSTKVKLAVDSGRITLYYWDKDEIELEVTNKIRGTGNEEKLLGIINEEFVLDIKEGTEVTIDGKCIKKDNQAPDRNINIVMRLPKRINEAQFDIKIGQVDIKDKNNTDYIINGEALKVDISDIFGKLTVNNKTGGVNLNNGSIKKDSEISLDLGNINMKCIFEEGNYSLKTNIGNIKISMPSSFDGNISTVGKVEKNEFSGGDSKTELFISCGMGKIEILRQQ